MDQLQSELDQSVDFYQKGKQADMYNMHDHAKEYYRMSATHLKKAKTMLGKSKIVRLRNKNEMAKQWLDNLDTFMDMKLVDLLDKISDE